LASVVSIKITLSQKQDCLESQYGYPGMRGRLKEFKNLTLAWLGFLAPEDLRF
jgi:hypothetical protein